MDVYNYGNFPFADQIMSQRIVYDGSGYPEYIGMAAPGAADADSVWMIKKLIYSGTNVISVLWASGNNAQNKAWTQRASYSYS